MPNPRKTERLKQLSGTARPDRKRGQDYAERLIDPPAPPAHLCPRAAAEWRALAPSAVGLGMLTASDLRAFQLLAQTLATASEAADLLAAEGLTLSTADGGRKSHPAVRILETARGQARALLAEFGLTPRARQGIDTLPPRPEASPFDEFVAEDPWKKLKRLEAKENPWDEVKRLQRDGEDEQ